MLYVEKGYHRQRPNAICEKREVLSSKKLQNRLATSLNLRNENRPRLKGTKCEIPSSHFFGYYKKGMSNGGGRKGLDKRNNGKFRFLPQGGPIHTLRKKPQR